MSQSSLLVGLLAATFLLYVAANGRLPVYTGVLWGPKPGSGSNGGNGGSGQHHGPDLSTIIDVGEHVLPFIVGG